MTKLRKTVGGSELVAKVAKLDTDLNPIKMSDKLDKTGDASNTTSTFTKASGDTSSMTSGGKLSAIFTAISSLFASLKALAFKDNVGTSDIADDAITAAKVKDDETLPVNVSGTARNLAAGGTAGYYLKSNGSSTAPTWDNPDDLYVGRAHNADHTYSAGNADNNGGHILVVNGPTQGFYEPYVTPNVKTYHSSSQGSSIRIGNTSGATTSDRKGSIVIGNGANAGTIFADNLTSFLEYQLPNAGGTLIPAADLGTSGQYLKSNGSSSAPTWADFPQSPDVSITSASDVSSVDSTLYVTGKYRLNVGSKSTTFSLSIPVVYYFTAAAGNTNIARTCTYNNPTLGNVVDQCLVVVTFPDGHARDQLQLKLETGYQTGVYNTVNMGTDARFADIVAGGSILVYLKSFTQYPNGVLVGEFNRRAKLELYGNNKSYHFIDNLDSGSYVSTYPTLSVSNGDTFNGTEQSLSNASGGQLKAIVLRDGSTDTRLFNWTDSANYCRYVDITVRICASYTSTMTSGNILELCPLIRESSTVYSDANLPELRHYFLAHANSSGDICTTLNARFQYDDFYNRFHGKELCFGVDFGTTGSSSQNIAITTYSIWTRVAHYGV